MCEKTRSGLKRVLQQQEQDPTNLYIANLPLNFDENDLSNLLFKYDGDVISTRILRTPEGASRGVGFARLESPEKCEEIITKLNGHPPPEMPDAAPLLVKLADSANRKVASLQFAQLCPFRQSETQM